MSESNEGLQPTVKVQSQIVTGELLAHPPPLGGRRQTAQDGATRVWSRKGTARLSRGHESAERRYKTRPGSCPHADRPRRVLEVAPPLGCPRALKCTPTGPWSPGFLWSRQQASDSARRVGGGASRRSRSPGGASWQADPVGWPLQGHHGLAPCWGWGRGWALPARPWPGSLQVREQADG